MSERETKPEHDDYPRDPEPRRRVVGEHPSGYGEGRVYGEFENRVTGDHQGVRRHYEMGQRTSSADDPTTEPRLAGDLEANRDDVQERNWIDRARDQVASWLGNEDALRRRREDRKAG